MKKKYNVFLFALLATFLTSIISCRKQELNGDPTGYSKNKNGKSTNSITEKEVIADWLEDHKQSLNPDEVKTLEVVSSNLSYNDLHVEARKNGENIIIIPINDAVKEHLNNNAKYLKLDESSTLNLIIVQSKEGKLRWSSIVAFLPKNGQKRTLSEKTIQNIINNEPVADDGMFKFIDLRGRLSYQLEYKKGKLYSWGSPFSEDELPKKEGQSPVKKNNKTSLSSTTCVAYFLITTYFYDDGSTSQTEEYLFTVCSEAPDGGGSGGGGGNPQPEGLDPEDPNDMEVETSGTIHLQLPLTNDDYAIPEGDDSINSFGIPTPIYFDAYWSAVRMAIKRRIKSVTMGDLHGYPINESYWVRGKGRISRNLTYDRGGKWYIIQNPLRVTAELGWEYSASVRYTYIDLGFSDKVEYTDQTHRKYIGIFDN